MNEVEFLIAWEIQSKFNDNMLYEINTNTVKR